MSKLHPKYRRLFASWVKPPAEPTESHTLLETVSAFALQLSISQKKGFLIEMQVLFNSER